MTPKTAVATGRALVPSARARAAIVRRLSASAGAMTTAVTQAMDARLPWFRQLGAQERSWITLVARAGIDTFARWFADDSDPAVDPLSIFNVAPQAMTRRISLQQTVDLVRTTIDVVEEQVTSLMPKADRLPLQTAIVQYSREVAFAAAQVYAETAESRAAWDQRIESIIVDALVRADVDEALASRASTLGWPSGAPVRVVAGDVPEGDAPGEDACRGLRSAVERTGLAVLCAAQGRRLIAVLCGMAIADEAGALDAVRHLEGCFGHGCVVIGSVAMSLQAAAPSAHEALCGARAAPAWPEGPRLLFARQLLPERAVLGDKAARAALVDLYRRLAQAGGDLLETCASFLDHTGSVEASARALYVHANTVRYRLKRIEEVTGYSPVDARDAYALRLCLTLGRLAPAGPA